MKPVSIAMLGSGFVADFYLQGLRDVNGQHIDSVRDLATVVASPLRAWRVTIETPQDRLLPTDVSAGIVLHHRLVTL